MQRIGAGKFAMSVLRSQDGKQHNEQTACADRRVCAERTGTDIQLNRNNDTEKPLGRSETETI